MDLSFEKKYKRQDFYSILEFDNNKILIRDKFDNLLSIDKKEVLEIIFNKTLKEYSNYLLGSDLKFKNLEIWSDNATIHQHHGVLGTTRNIVTKSGVFKDVLKRTNKKDFIQFNNNIIIIYKKENDLKNSIFLSTYPKKMKYSFLNHSILKSYSVSTIDKISSFEEISN